MSPVTVAAVTSAAVDDAAVQAPPPVRQATSNAVSLVEASVQDSLAAVEPAAVAMSPVGAGGESGGPTLATLLGVESPFAFVAMTRNS